MGTDVSEKSASSVSCRVERGGGSFAPNVGTHLPEYTAVITIDALHRGSVG